MKVSSLWSELIIVRPGGNCIMALTAMLPKNKQSIFPMSKTLKTSPCFHILQIYFKLLRFMHRYRLFLPPEKPMGNNNLCCAGRCDNDYQLLQHVLVS